MAFRSHLELIDLNMRVPRGNEAFWELILALDKAGPWTIRQLVDRSNVTTGAIGQFVDALRLAGIAEVVERRLNGRPGLDPAAFYRLTRRPLDCPRLRRDGTELPEPQVQVLWRTMRMVKSFSPRELVDLASEGGRSINLSHARSYVSLLISAGVVVQQKSNGHGQEGLYRLKRDLGPRAPKILHARIVFDPNSSQVLGEAKAREVSP